jgi:transposase
VISLSNSLLVGIDVSLNDNKVRILHPDGTSLLKFVVRNSIPGAQTLSQKVTKIAESNNFDSITIGLEATSVYGDPLVYFLKDDASINKFNTKIHVLNPTQVNKFKKMYPELPKTDDIDAWVIAEHLRFGRINKEVYMDDRYKACKNLQEQDFIQFKTLLGRKTGF